MKTSVGIFFSPVILFFLLLISSCHAGNSGSKTSSSDSGKINIDSMRYIYIGTYTKADNSQAVNPAGIYVLKFNLNTGALTKVSESPETSNPSYLALSHDKQFLYAVNENGGDGPADFGSVSAFHLDSQTHKMQFLNSVSSKGKSPCYISLDTGSKFAMVANYNSGTVSLYPLNSNGNLEEASFVNQDKGKGPNAARQEGPHAHMISTDQSGKYIYATDLGTDQLTCYTLDTIKKQLVNTGHTTTLTAGAGPRHFTFHPVKPWIYIINELNGTIEGFNQDQSTGVLSRFQIISTLPAGTSIPADCADIHITPSGKYLYASNRGENNSIAMYSINEATGQLSLIGHQSTKGKIPRNFAIDPSGKYLLVANQNSSNIVVFRIDDTTGKLVDANQEISIPMPVCIKFQVE